MTKLEFNQAIDLVESGADLSQFDDLILHGCGLYGSEPVTVSLEVAAKFIGYQARQLNGQWDCFALNEMREISRRKFLIV